MAVVIYIAYTILLSILQKLVVTRRLIVPNVIVTGLFFIFREQRQKEANKMAVNSFPKDRDYRREVMQATATSAFASGSKYFFLNSNDVWFIPVVNIYMLQI